MPFNCTALLCEPGERSTALRILLLWFLILALPAQLTQAAVSGPDVSSGLLAPQEGTALARVASPDGNIEFSFDRGLKLVGSAVASHDEAWEQPWGTGPIHGATTRETERYMDFAAKYGVAHYEWHDGQFMAGEVGDYVVFARQERGDPFQGGR